MSGDRYIITDQHAIYFLTFTVIDWVDVFSRKEHCMIITDSLNYCIKEKGLAVYAWVVMTNHIHLVAKAREPNCLSDIIRDFKKYTSKRILYQIENGQESRREWLLRKFEFAGRRIKRNQQYKLWKDDNHAVLLDNNDMIDQRINYIHNNPVKAMIVDNASAYVFSSARDYEEEPGLVEIDLMC